MFLEELICIILSSKFHAAAGISKCGAHASLPFGRTYVHNFLYVLYLHWSPNPKCCLVPLKPSGPHIFKASTRTQSLSRLLRRGPIRRSTPTNPTRRTHHRFTSRGRGRSGFVVEAPTLGCPRCRTHHWFSLFFMLLRPRVK